MMIELLINFLDVPTSRSALSFKERFTYGSMTNGTVLCVLLVNAFLKLVGPGPPVSESDVSYCVPLRLVQPSANHLPTATFTLT